ncbi:MAG: MBOAT family protein [Deltaproteobacteria bacterium]|nr:MBOAT family protein [Deltaproteobacteria bacterium]
MLFNTITYAYFFSVVFAVSWLLHRHPRARLGFLLAASYVFYAGWTFVGFQRLVAAHGAERWALVVESVKFLPILFVGTSIDWLLGVWLDRIEDARRRRWMLVATILLNVGILIFFKYWNWGASMFLWLFRERLGIAVPDPRLEVELPIGISFFCFMSLSYVIDVYRRTIPACRSYLNYLAYVSFFPHLVAGPIVRGRDLLPHLERPTRLTASTGGEGFFLIATGLFKKVVVGDYLAVNFVDRVFAEPMSYSGLESLSALYCYSIQLYCDFSGYSDIAIGSALLLGYRFKINFDQPFKAGHVADFWRRWHISLSSWLRDYVYFTLGGSKRGDTRKYLNVFLTMLICGIWHGAAWTFVFFGLVNGLGVAGTHWVREKLLPARGQALGRALTIAVVASLVVDLAMAFFARGFALPGLSDATRMLLVGAWISVGVVALLRHGLGDASAWPARIIGVAGTFTYASFGFVFFRASSLEKASALFERIGTLTTYAPNLHASVLGVLAGALVLQWLPRRWGEVARERFIAAPAFAQAVILFAIAFALRKAASMETVPFVYFQF